MLGRSGTHLLFKRGFLNDLVDIQFHGRIKPIFCRMARAVCTAVTSNDERSSLLHQLGDESMVVDSYWFCSAGSNTYCWWRKYVLSLMVATCICWRIRRVFTMWGCHQRRELLQTAACCLLALTQVLLAVPSARNCLAGQTLTRYWYKDSCFPLAEVHNSCRMTDGR